MKKVIGVTSIIILAIVFSFTTSDVVGQNDKLNLADLVKIKDAQAECSINGLLMCVQSNGDCYLYVNGAFVVCHNASPYHR